MSWLVFFAVWLSGAVFGYLWRYTSVRDTMWRANDARRDLDAIDVMERIRTRQP